METADVEAKDKQMFCLSYVNGSATISLSGNNRMVDMDHHNRRSKGRWIETERLDGLGAVCKLIKWSYKS